jgi:hypothetical protein
VSLSVGGQLSASRKSSIALSMARLGYDRRIRRDCRLWLRREGLGLEGAPPGRDERSWLLNTSDGGQHAAVARIGVGWLSLAVHLLALPFVLGLADNRHHYWTHPGRAPHAAGRVYARVSGWLFPGLADLVLRRGTPPEVVAFARGLRGRHARDFLARLAYESPAVALRALAHGRFHGTDLRPALGNLLQSEERVHRERAVQMVGRLRSPAAR